MSLLEDLKAERELANELVMNKEACIMSTKEIIDAAYLIPGDMVYNIDTSKIMIMRNDGMWHNVSSHRRTDLGLKSLDEYEIF